MSAIDPSIDDCRQCARLFRLGRDVEAALIMVDVFEGVQVSLVSAPANIQQSWAQVLTAIAPPAVQAILDPETNKTPKPEQLMQQMKQMEESLKEALKHAHDAQAEADEAMEQVHNKREENEAKERELNIKAYDAETKRLQLTSAAMTPEQIQLMVAQTVEAMLSNPTPLPNEAPQQIDPATPPGEQPAPQEQVQPEPDPNDPGQMDAQAPPGLPDPNDPAAMQTRPNPPSAGFSLPEPQPGA